MEPGYVIIGNSTAATGAVEGIRRIDRKMPVSVISDEPYLTYSRPLISYYLGGMVDEDGIYYRKSDFYEKNNVKPILGIKAASIDIKAKAVILENGAVVPYSKLLVATGGKPFKPPVDGLEKKNVFGFIKMDDAKKISEAVVPGSKAIVIGASFSGLKAVEALIHRGADVTVIDIMDRIMPRIFDKTASAIIEDGLAAQGVKVMLGTTVESLTGAEAVDGVMIKGEGHISCDFAVLAIGVRCNTDIAAGTGIEVNRGIKVDDRMRTNIPDIYAAGDVAEGYNFIERKYMEIAIISNAYKQGETAGINMAGGDRAYNEGMAMNSMPLLGMTIMSAGISEQQPGVEVKAIYRPEGKIYKKFYIRDNRLAGFLLVNDPDRAGLYTDLVRNGTDIAPFIGDIGESSFGLASLPKEARKSKMLDWAAVQ